MTSELLNGVLKVTVCLIVMVPLLTVLLGEIVDRLRRMESVYVRFFSNLRAVMLPLLVVFILAKFVFHLDNIEPEPTGEQQSHFIFQLVLSALYIAVAYSLYLLIGALKNEKDPEAWENRVPSLFKAIATALVFMAPVFLLLRTWGVEVGDFAKVVGIAGLAIGLALQDALSSVTKGFLLVVDKPFAVGDWIEVNGVKGKVLDISWRSTRLLVKDYDIVVIPNLIISDNSVYNYTAMYVAYWDEFSLGFSYDDPPSKVKEVLLKVLIDCPDVMHDPVPRIHTESYGDFAIRYSVHFCIERYVDTMDQLRIRDEILSRIWYAAERGGISIPFPINIEGPPELFAPDSQKIRQDIVRFLSKNRYFSCLEPETLVHLSEIAKTASFSKGETLFCEGDIATGIWLVHHGEISFSNTEDSQRQHLDSAHRHDLICEVALMGRRANRQTAVAVTDVSIISFSPKQLNPVIEENPKLERLLGQLVKARMSKRHQAGVESASGNDPGPRLNSTGRPGWKKAS